MRTPYNKKAARLGAASNTSFRVNHNAPGHISQYLFDALLNLTESSSPKAIGEQGEKS